MPTEPTPPDAAAGPTPMTPPADNGQDGGAVLLELATAPTAPTGPTGPSGPSGPTGPAVMPPPPPGPAVWWPAPDGLAPTVPAASSRRLSRPVIALIVILSLVSMGVVALVVLGILLGADPLTHDLVEADFSDGASPFGTGTGIEVRYDTAHGTLRGRSTDPFPSGSASLQFSSAWYARTAFNVNHSIVVAWLNDPSDFVFIGCSENTDDEPTSAFLFGIRGTEVLMLHHDATAGGARILARTERGRTLQAGDHLQLSCRTEDPFGGSSISLTGLVNGEAMMHVSHELLYRHGFNAMNIGFDPAGPGHEVRFDNASANVPDE